MLNFHGDRLFKVVTIVFWVLVVITPLNIIIWSIQDQGIQLRFIFGIMAIFGSPWLLVYYLIYIFHRRFRKPALLLIFLSLVPLGMSFLLLHTYIN